MNKEARATVYKNQYNNSQWSIIVNNLTISIGVEVANSALGYLGS